MVLLKLTFEAQIDLFTLHHAILIQAQISILATFKARSTLVMLCY